MRGSTRPREFQLPPSSVLLNAHSPQTLAGGGLVKKIMNVRAHLQKNEAAFFSRIRVMVTSLLGLLLLLQIGLASGESPSSEVVGGRGQQHRRVEVTFGRFPEAASENGGGSPYGGGGGGGGAGKKKNTFFL